MPYCFSDVRLCATCPLQLIMSNVLETKNALNLCVEIAVFFISVGAVNRADTALLKRNTEQN